MIIIGISGKKQSGKDTVCQIMLDKFKAKGYPAVRLGFADALKEEVAKGCGVTVNYIEQHKNNFRLILQGWGKDFRRDLISEDYWIVKLLDKVNNLPDNTYVIIPDVRLLNEFDTLKLCGATILRVERDIPTTDTHQSETDLDNAIFDNIINNSGTLEELSDNVENILLYHKLI
jgi:hypothetical protein